MKLETIKQKLLGDERAVSPVIGVILMVAITVILAAVIGTFVLGLGENVSQTAPQASMSFSDSSFDYTGGGGSAEEAFIITHDGGSELPANEIKIVVRLASSNAEQATWDGSSTAMTVELNGSPLGTGDVVATGDTVVLTDSSGSTFTDGAQYKIQIIHKNSESTVASGTVTLN